MKGLSVDLSLAIMSSFTTGGGRNEHRIFCNSPGAEASVASGRSRKRKLAGTIPPKHFGALQGRQRTLRPDTCRRRAHLPFVDVLMVY
eukprot:7157076-Pyramimonas_sp.AAC.1